MPDEPKKHCFHHDGVGIQRGYSMEWNETCCNCGGKRGMASGSESTPGHGPHVYVKKSVTVVTSPPKDEHCTPAPVPSSPPFTSHLILGGSSSS